MLKLDERNLKWMNQMENAEIIDVPLTNLTGAAQVSVAISLKRIADSLELIAHGDNQHEGILRRR